MGTFTTAFIYEAIDKVSPTIAMIKTKVKKATKAMGAGFKKVGVVLDKTSKKLKRVADKLGKVGSKMSSIGRTISTKITLPLLALGGVIVHQGTKFENSMASLAAITGLTAEEVKKLQPAIMKTGETFGLSSASIAKGMELIGSANPELLKTPKLMLEVAKASAMLSKASGESFEQTSADLADIMGKFGIQGDQAFKVANVMAAASKFGAQNVPLLTLAMKESVAVAKLSKISLEDTASALEIIGAKAFKGARGGIQFRNILVKLETGAKKFRPSAVGLTTALENLKKANLSVAKKTKLFGAENLVTAEALLNNVDAIKQMTKNITGTQVALEQAKKNMATLTEEAKRLWIMISNKLIIVFEMIRPALSAGLKMIRKVIEALSVWAKKNPGTAKTIGFIVIAIGILGPAIAALGTIISFVSTVIAGLSIAMVIIVAKIALVIAGIAILVGGLLFFASGASEAATWTERLALMWEKLQEVMAFMWAEIEPILTDLKDSFRSLIPVFQEIWPLVQPLIKGVFVVSLMAIVAAIKLMLAPLRIAAKLLAFVTGGRKITATESEGAKAVAATQARLDAMNKAKAAGLTGEELKRSARVGADDLLGLAKDAKEKAAAPLPAGQDAKATVDVNVKAEPGTEITSTKTSLQGAGNIGVNTIGTS